MFVYNPQFHFDQSKIRSHIRLCEGQMKAIDVLSKQLDVSNDLDVEIDELYMVFQVSLLTKFYFQAKLFAPLCFSL